METRTDDERFEGTGTQAAARWLIALVAPSEDITEGKETADAPRLLSDFDKALWCGFMVILRPQLEELFIRAENPASLAGLLSDAAHEIARKLKEE